MFYRLTQISIGNVYFAVLCLNDCRVRIFTLGTLQGKYWLPAFPITGNGHVKHIPSGGKLEAAGGVIVNNELPAIFEGYCIGAGIRVRQH